MAKRRFRLGIYTDMVFRWNGSVFSTDLSFILFLIALAPRFEEIVLCLTIVREPHNNLSASRSKRKLLRRPT
jgi:hypothetical protein